MGGEIRAAETRDHDEVRSIALSAHAMYEEILTPDNYEKMRSGVSRIVEVATDGTLLVAESEGEIMGVVVCMPPHSPRPDIFEFDWAVIRMLSVAPGYRGRGVGRMLSEACIRKARDEGAETIALHTGEMMTAARKIYESLGFEILREIEPRFGCRYWFYTREL